MKHLILTLALLINFAYADAYAAKAEILSQETKSWDDTALKYPEGEAEITIVKIIIEPGDALDFHCHPFPSAAYVMSGDLKVTLSDDTFKEFHKGETITEVVNRLHKGTNLSKTNPVELIVFYAGEKNTPITIHELENCKK